MITLDKEQVIRLHQKLLGATGGLEGVRDDALLESALSAPFHTFNGVELFPSTAAKIARIAYGIVRNHPFADGNKRIGTYVMMILLDLNHIKTNFSDYDIVYIGLALASGEMDDKQLLEFIRGHEKMRR